MTTRLKILKCIADARFGGPHRRSFAIAERLRVEGVETVFLFGPPTDGPNPPCPFEHSHLTHVLFLRRKHPVFNLLAFLLLLPRNLLRIRRIIKSRQIDLVDVDGVLNVPPALAAWWCGVPVLWYYNDPLLGPIERVLLPLVAKVATAMVVQSDQLRQTRTASYPLLREKTKVLYPGTDTTVFDPDRYGADVRGRMRQQWRIPTDSPLIGVVGNLNPFKGHEDFLQAAATIKERLGNARFIIVGRRLPTAPGHWERLQSLTVKLGLEADVVYTGFCDKIPAVLAALDVFVLPSTRESSPNVVLEAMAMRVPVVATDVGAVSELVRDGVTGTVVPPRQPDALAGAVLEMLAKSPEERHRITEAARKAIQTQFSLDATARLQRELYETTLHRAAT